MEKNIEYFKRITDTEFSTLKEDIKEIKFDVKEMNASFQKMENWKSKVIGIAISFSLIFSMVSSWVINYFKS